MTDQKKTATEEEVPGGGEPEVPEEEHRKVPLNVLKTVEEKLKEANEENARLKVEAEEAEQLRQKVALYQANPSYAQNQPAPQPPPTQESNPFDGMDEDDFLTVAQAKQAFTTPASVPTDQIDALNQKVGELSLKLIDPNYEKTLNTYLPRMIQEDPHLVNIIKSSADPVHTALKFANMGKRMADAAAAASEATPLETEQPSISDQLARIIENNHQPQSPAAAGTGSAAIQNVDRFLQMSPTEFKVHKAKVISGK